nr:immunoglobulin heavy chain junction region [Macaca mulatta]MOX92694.1 immunoglobulin heavy chain junction region [Macaca mulatta]MOX93510.1 immunoglobulin heavy chain junction region [Macaca mulatta]MOX93822.1 immunoglobulin heavy chain junction region [Macaca mulatta]MOX96246.1 immunoglobulin heavy chain junction region [Macaca mulatta]
CAGRPSGTYFYYRSDYW